MSKHTKGTNIKKDFVVDNPWDIISENPKMAWYAIKLQDDKLAEQRKEIETLKEEIVKLQNSAKINGILQYCGENIKR